MSNKTTINGGDTVHLFDLGTIADMANWVLNNVIVPGVVGITSSYIYDQIKGLKDRHGRAIVNELESEVRKRSDALGDSTEVSSDERKQRIDSIFIKFK